MIDMKLPLAQTQPTPLSLAFLIAKSMENFPTTGPATIKTTTIMQQQNKGLNHGVGI